MNIFAALVCVRFLGCTSNKPITKARQPELAPMFVLVGGEVKQRGQFAWKDGITASEVIHLAGGFTEYFSSHKVVVHHWDGSFEYLQLTPDYRLKKDILLRPGDTIFAPVW